MLLRSWSRYSTTYLQGESHHNDYDNDDAEDDYDDDDNYDDYDDGEDDDHLQV